TYCQYAAALPLNATPTGAASLIWYGTSASGGAPSPIATTPQTTNSGTSNYYVSQIENGCESPRSPIAVTINALPIVNAGNDTTISEGSAIILKGKGNATTYIWNNGVTDGSSFTPLSTESG